MKVETQMEDNEKNLLNYTECSLHVGLIRKIMKKSIKF